MSEESRKMAKLAVEALEDKKAEDIKVIDISNVSVIADYFIIAGGNNSSQIQALCDLSLIHIEMCIRDSRFICQSPWTISIRRRS